MNGDVNNQKDTQSSNSVELLEPILNDKSNANKAKVFVNNLKNPNKSKKTIIMFFGVLVLCIIIVLFISMQKKYNNGGSLINEDGTLSFETGTTWGDSYALFIQKEMSDYTQYDVSLVDLDFNGTPEMLVKYQDKSNNDTLKIFYISDKEVFSTKYYHLYSLHMLYSVVDKSVGWYIFISSNGDYGAYTSLDKVINGKAFDSDIKVTTDRLLEEYNKAYVDGKYKLVFYQVNTSNFEVDMKTIIGRYTTYEKDINTAIDKLKSENSSKEYVSSGDEDKYQNVDAIAVKGRRISFGTYTGSYKGENDEILVNELIIKRDGTIIYNDVLYKFDVGYDKIIFNNDQVLDITGNNMFIYNNVNYIYAFDENGNKV